jgi:hypothetical protein
MRPEDRKKTTRALRGWGQQRMRSNYIEGAQKTDVGAEKKTSGPFARPPKEPAQSKLF